MFTEQLPAALFEKQREFIRAMGGKLDFEWAALTLVSEEVKELEEAYAAKEISDENLCNIFKEIGDVVYVVAYTYNTLPPYAFELISKERGEKIMDVMTKAADVMTNVCQHMKIPAPLIHSAFNVVHDSNMSKLDEDGNPVRREDGKIMKGPNYVAPDMMPVVNAWKQFIKNEESKG